MTKVQGSSDCGNSPKNKFAQEVAIALETGEFLADGFSDDLVWYDNTDEPVQGKAAVVSALDGAAKPTSIVVDHAIAHGKVGAANGEVTLASGYKRRFSHIIEFTSTKGSKVAVVKSYS